MNPSRAMDCVTDFLRELFKPLKSLGRPAKLAEPFIGLGGASEMLRAAGVPVQSMNVFDIDERLARFHALKSAHTEHHLVNLCFGEIYGGFCNFPKEGLADVDGDRMSS